MSLVKINKPLSNFYTAVQQGELLDAYSAIDSYCAYGELPHLDPSTQKEVDETYSDHDLYTRYYTNKAKADKATAEGKYYLEFEVENGKIFTATADFSVFGISQGTRLTGKVELYASTLPSPTVLKPSTLDNAKTLIAVNVANFPLDLSAATLSGTAANPFTDLHPSYLGYVQSLTGVAGMYANSLYNRNAYTHTYTPGLKLACAGCTRTAFGQSYYFDASDFGLAASPTLHGLYAGTDSWFFKPPYSSSHTDYTNAFANSTFYTLDLSGFDFTGKTTTTMFDGCSNLQAIIAVGCNQATLTAINAVKPQNCLVFTRELYIPPLTEHNWTISRSVGGTPFSHVNSGVLTAGTTYTGGNSCVQFSAPTDYMSVYGEKHLALCEVLLDREATSTSMLCFEHFIPGLQDPYSGLALVPELTGGKYTLLPKGKWSVATWITTHKQATGATNNRVTLGTFTPSTYLDSPIKYKNFHIYLP